MELDALKQLYQENAAQHDPCGFKLYHAAVDMTGFDLYSAFPYEDNRGMFEEADGHQLLRYLIADHFRAVDWAIVPGTCCEKAALREVDITTKEYQAFEQKLYQKVLEKMGVIAVKTNLAEINKDTFWTLIARAKEKCGQDLDASADWLEAQLIEMGPEAAQSFDNILHGYSALADKFGLWTAASMMLNGCTDDGFIDFRSWLIAQGKEVYLAALKDPDTLADVPLYGGGCFESLAYIGDSAYKKMTGRSAYDSLDLPAYEHLRQELARDIEYGEGIDYPYRWNEAADYLPRLCEKYLTPEDLANMIQRQNDSWNPINEDVQRARATAKKGKKLGGEAR